jgi:hypothetical protein
MSQWREVTFFDGRGTLADPFKIAWSDYSLMRNFLQQSDIEYGNTLDADKKEVRTRRRLELAEIYPQLFDDCCLLVGEFFPLRIRREAWEVEPIIPTAQ